MEKLKFYNGNEIPQLGFGVFKTEDGETCINAVKWALEAGSRHIDTATVYRNEKSVGIAMKESGVAREDIFLTTKLSSQDVRAKNAIAAFEKSLEELQTDYVDLYLIHWPWEYRTLAWKEMIEFYKQGRAKAIGVSNFTVECIEELEQLGMMLPMVNQIESNPYYQNDDIIEYCQKRGIVVEVYSPLGGTGGHIMEDETLKQIAAKHNKSVAQIIIRWHMQRGVVVLTKSTHKNRIIENLDVEGFELDAEDMALIKSINKNEKTGRYPEDVVKQAKENELAAEQQAQ